MYEEDITLACKANTLKINHKKWRKVLQAIEGSLKAINWNYTICGPFGFELCWNAKTAPKTIRKFYIYTNNPEELEPTELANQIEIIAFQQIKKHYIEIIDDFVAIIKNQCLKLKKEKTYQCQPADKLLDIQVRNITTNILDDYANYIILVYQSILNKSGEAQHYEHSALFRSRLFQLSVMLYQLYGSFCQENYINDDDIDVYFCRYISNKIQLFFDQNQDESPITITEKTLINTKIIPFCEYIRDSILTQTVGDKTITIELDSYHHVGSAPLYAEMSINLYHKLKKHVVDSYQDFVSI